MENDEFNEVKSITLVALVSLVVVMVIVVDETIVSFIWPMKLPEIPASVDIGTELFNDVDVVDVDDDDVDIEEVLGAIIPENGTGEVSCISSSSSSTMSVPNGTVDEDIW